MLGALTSDARANLQTLLIGLGSTLDLPPTPAQDATVDPSVRGLTAGQALNKSLNYSAEAFKASAIVNQALLGQQPHDLTQVVVGNEQVFRGLAASSHSAGQPRDASSTPPWRRSRPANRIWRRRSHLLPPLLNATNAADTALDASFPPTQQFAAAIVPSLPAVAPTITVALPWLRQATELVSPQYLGGLLQSLTPAVQNTASSLHATTSLLSGLDLFARCVSHNLVPTGNEVINDPPQSTGLTVYEELYQSAVGLAGAAGNFDGNGRYIRSSAGGGAIPRADQLRARNRPAVRQRRAATARHPAGVHREGAADQPQRRLLQERQAEPQQGQHRGRPVKRAILVHRRDFAAIAGLAVLAVAVAAYILGHQPAFTFGRATTRSRRRSRPRRRSRVARDRP